MLLEILGKKLTIAEDVCPWLLLGSMSYFPCCRNCGVLGEGERGLTQQPVEVSDFTDGDIKNVIRDIGFFLTINEDVCPWSLLVSMSYFPCCRNCGVLGEGEG